MLLERTTNLKEIIGYAGDIAELTENSQLLTNMKYLRLGYYLVPKGIKQAIKGINKDEVKRDEADIYFSRKQFHFDWKTA
jgi:hypothetical protein